MLYTIAQWPHANRRYLDGMTPLALCELELIGRAFQTAPSDLRAEERGRARFLTFRHPGLTERDKAALFRMSSLYMLFEGEDGAMRALYEPAATSALGDDIAGVLKYKGKTNEMFTDALLNFALFSSAFAHRFDEPLNICDPVCGRGTTLFQAAKKGYNALGIDSDAKEIEQGVQYFEKYLEFHRIKHKKNKSSKTVDGKGAGVCYAWIYAENAERFKGGHTRELSFVLGDARNAAAFAKPKSQHVIAADLPYGVQRGAQGGKGGALGLLRDCADSWARALTPGGAMAISFNTHTLKRKDALDALESAGLRAMREPAYEGLSHWVEQAIERDCVVGARPM